MTGVLHPCLSASLLWERVGLRGEKAEDGSVYQAAQRLQTGNVERGR